MDHVCVFVGTSILFVPVIVIIAIRYHSKIKPPTQALHPYEAVPSLLTPAELAFDRSLSMCIPEGYSSFVKVRVADIIRVRRGHPEWRSWFGKISQKHVDYVIADLELMVVACVIELDDKSHKRRDRQQRDEFVDWALANSGIPVIRIQVSNSYDTNALRKQIYEACNYE